MDFFGDALQCSTKNDKDKIKSFIAMQKCKFTWDKYIPCGFESGM